MKTGKTAETENIAPSLVNVEVLLTVIFDYNNAVHRELLSEGRIAYKNYYLELVPVRHFLVKKNIAIISKPPYLSDLVPYNFGCLSKIGKTHEKSKICTIEVHITSYY